MPDPQFIKLSATLVAELAAVAGPASVLTDPESVESYSKDFYWYSPILKEKLDDKRADIVVKVTRLETLKKVVALCFQAGVPITLRGAATGNYGQCVPLYGGVVIDLNGFDRIISVEGGVARCEPGAKLGAIESEARKAGYELRCYPSTWVKASIGGFVGGGSGGIGSITYGGIRDADNMKSITLLTIEAEPRLIRLEEQETLKAQHTYGTTGIMVELEMRLGVKREWDQLAFSSDSFDALLDFTEQVAVDDQIPKRLVTLHEWPIPGYFKPLRKWLPENQHAAFFEIEAGRASETVKAMAIRSAIKIVHFIPAHEPRRPPMLSDYTWNHTTLWAIKHDPSITYLQSGFGENYREKLNLLRARFPDEIYFHLEFVKGNAKMGERFSSAGCGGIPLVRFKSKERLQEMIDYCTTIGVFTANPHSYVLEEGGRHPEIASKRALKDEADPKALLNPGKMGSYPNNPFSKTAAAGR